MTKLTIKASSIRVSIGHQSHIAGVGVHGDKRTKRNRTRSTQKRSALKEWA